VVTADGSAERRVKIEPGEHQHVSFEIGDPKVPTYLIWFGAGVLGTSATSFALSATVFRDAADQATTPRKLEEAHSRVELGNTIGFSLSLVGTALIGTGLWLLFDT
jgi:hypothetical protein